MIALESEKASLLEDDIDLPPQSTAFAWFTTRYDYRPDWHAIIPRLPRLFGQRIARSSDLPLISPTSSSGSTPSSSTIRFSLPFFRHSLSLSRRHILIAIQLFAIQSVLLVTVLQIFSDPSSSRGGGSSSFSPFSQAPQSFYNNRTLLFLPGETHILPLPTNATLRVQLTHEPLDPAAFVLTLLRATNEVMAAPADLSKGTDRVFDTQRTSWYELAPQNRAKGGLALLGGMFERKPEVVERLRSSSDGSDEEDKTKEKEGEDTKYGGKEAKDGKKMKGGKETKEMKGAKGGKQSKEVEKVKEGKKDKGEQKAKEEKKVKEGRKVIEGKEEKSGKAVKGKKQEEVLKEVKGPKQKHESTGGKDKDMKKSKKKSKSDKGVYIHLQLEKYQSHRFDKVLVMGVLQALHKFRERPYQGQLIIKGRDGIEYGVGCIGDRNGTCA